MQVISDARMKMSSLVTAAGGLIEEDIFVLTPGCMILSCTESTPAAKALYNLFNIDKSRPSYEQRAEFKSRLTYLAFRDEPVCAERYNERMAREFQHLSVYSSTSVEFLIAGIAIETSMELIAHGEASVGRLTSSKTNSMDQTLYRLQGSCKERERQKLFTREFLQLREKFDRIWSSEEKRKEWGEFRNMLNIPTKVTALSYTMTIKDYHKLFIGRLSNRGNETEVQEICRTMCEQLHDRYPLVIRSPDEYYELNNGEKYR